VSEKKKEKKKGIDEVKFTAVVTLLKFQILLGLFLKLTEKKNFYLLMNIDIISKLILFQKEK